MRETVHFTDLIFRILLQIFLELFQWSDKDKL